MATADRQHTAQLLDSYYDTVVGLLENASYDQTTGIRLHTLASSLAMTIGWHRFDHEHHTRRPLLERRPPRRPSGRRHRPRRRHPLRPRLPEHLARPRRPRDRHPRPCPAPHPGPHRPLPAPPPQSPGPGHERRSPRLPPSPRRGRARPRFRHRRTPGMVLLDEPRRYATCQVVSPGNVSGRWRPNRRSQSQASRPGDRTGSRDWARSTTPTGRLSKAVDEVAAHPDPSPCHLKRIVMAAIALRDSPRPESGSARHVVRHLPRGVLADRLGRVSKVDLGL